MRAIITSFTIQHFDITHRSVESSSSSFLKMKIANINFFYASFKVVKDKWKKNLGIQEKNRWGFSYPSNASESNFRSGSTANRRNFHRFLCVMKEKKNLRGEKEKTIRRRRRRQDVHPSFWRQRVVVHRQPIKSRSSIAHLQRDPDYKKRARCIYVRTRNQLILSRYTVRSFWIARAHVCRLSQRFIPIPTTLSSLSLSLA